MIKINGKTQFEYTSTKLSSQDVLLYISQTRMPVNRTEFVYHILTEFPLLSIEFQAMTKNDDRIIIVYFLPLEISITFQFCHPSFENLLAISVHCKTVLNFTYTFDGTNLSQGILGINLIQVATELVLQILCDSIF